jgi:hypothetical protein
MATVAAELPTMGGRTDRLSGTPRAAALDRWIFVIMAAWFVLVILVGFVPDSLGKVAAVQAGLRAPFPLVLHLHALLIGTFMLLLLTQTILMATGKDHLHMRVGVAAFVVAPALVVVGVVLVPTIYYSVWDAAHNGPPGLREAMQHRLPAVDNVMLLQFRAGLLFPLFLAIGLRARRGDAGLHKRMMLLAPAVALVAAIARMDWLPSTLPSSQLSLDLFMLVVVSPLFVWDVVRNHAVHRAWWIWLGVNVPAALLVFAAWDTPWWHATARQIMNV